MRRHGDLRCGKTERQGLAAKDLERPLQLEIPVHFPQLKKNIGGSFGEFIASQHAAPTRRLGIFRATLGHRPSRARKRRAGGKRSSTRPGHLALCTATARRRSRPRSSCFLPRTRPRTSQASLCPSQAGIWATHDGAGPNPANIVGMA
jgi:hypothetical protein